MKVWTLKEAFQSFFECPRVEEGEAVFQGWREKVRLLGNPRLEAVAEQLKTQWDGVIA